MFFNKSAKNPYGDIGDLSRGLCLKCCDGISYGMKARCVGLQCTCTIRLIRQLFGMLDHCHVCCLVRPAIDQLVEYVICQRDACFDEWV